MDAHAAVELRVVERDPPPFVDAMVSILHVATASAAGQGIAPIVSPGMPDIVLAQAGGPDGPYLRRPDGTLYKPETYKPETSKPPPEKAGQPETQPKRKKPKRLRKN